MSWKTLLSVAYNNDTVRRIFRLRPYILQREMRDCSTLLDLGCGPTSVIKFLQIPWSVGVELHVPYIRETVKERIHNEYVLADVRAVQFREKCFDCVLASDVIEHLSKEEGYELIRKMKSIARKKIIVTTTNGFIRSEAIDGNPFQIHRSGWNVSELKGLGFKVWGLTGLKHIRERSKLPSHGDVLETVRFRPRPLWLLIAEATEILTWYMPEMSFELFCVKTMC